LGLTVDLAWKFGTYGFELQSNIFQNGQPKHSPNFRAVDLLATNIQRGRDNGLKPYIHYVKMCHNIVVNTWNDLWSLMNGQNIQALQSVYEYNSFKQYYVFDLNKNNLIIDQFKILICMQVVNQKNHH
jgi:hypothetical protein